MHWDEPLMAGTRVVIRSRPKTGQGCVVSDIAFLQPTTPVRVLLDDGRKEWFSGMDLLAEPSA